RRAAPPGGGGAVTGPRGPCPVAPVSSSRRSLIYPDGPRHSRSRPAPSHLRRLRADRRQVGDPLRPSMRAVVRVSQVTLRLRAPAIAPPDPEPVLRAVGGGARGGGGRRRSSARPRPRASGSSR